MAKKAAGPSTRNLGALPDPQRLRALTKSLALLDEILCDDWESRYYSYDVKWGKNEELASMRNGSGDDWFLWFCRAGLVLLGFDHEASPMTPYARKDHSLWPGLLAGLPGSLRAALEEPAFSPKDLTFCIWRTREDDAYRIGDIAFPKRSAGTVEPFRSDPDGSAMLLGILDDHPQTYVAYASEYFEVDLPLAAVRKVYAHDALDAATVRALNEEADVGEISKSARALGFRFRR